MLSAVPARTRLSALVLLLLTTFGTVAVATPAEAATLSQRVMAEAARHKGKPYQYGAAGPYKFDCSGYTLYVYRRVTGVRLPHSSRSQYDVTRHIRKADKRPGDLIFIYSSSGRIYHVGIYAGSGRMWHAPKPGSVVKLATIWTSMYKVGRVRV